jgi:hypothetical protein
MAPRKVAIVPKKMAILANFDRLSSSLGGACVKVLLAGLGKLVFSDVTIF